jgi:ribosome-associated protein YbcJ (S4-like RNA binding protein)
MLAHIENLIKVAKIIQSGSRIKHIGRIIKEAFVLEEKRK